MLLHGGWLHFLGNMWFLRIFGSKVEDRMGHSRFLVFYLLAGVLASMFYIYFSPGSSMPVIGASGRSPGSWVHITCCFPGKDPYIHSNIYYPVVYRASSGLFSRVVVFAAALFGTVAQVCPHPAGAGVVGPYGGFIAGVLLVFFFKRPSVK